MCAEFDGFHGGCGIVFATEHDDGDFWVRLGEVFEAFETVHDGHVEIEKDSINVVLDEFEYFATIGGSDGCEAVVRCFEGKEFSYGGVIVCDDEIVCCWFGHKNILLCLSW